MHVQPTFLTFLGVPFDADERAIRRAYARLLKQIDQASEADKFQQLREAYEAALAWVGDESDGISSRVPFHGPAAVPGRLKPGELSPRDAAETALRDLLAEVDAYRRFGSRAMEDLVDALNAALESDALVSLDARELFEAQLANRLAQGWQPGHEMLFPTARLVLGWWEDPARLRGLGAVAAFLERAIEQEAASERRSFDDLVMQRDVLAQLRQADLPEEQFMRAAFPYFEELAYHMPQWLAVVAPREQVQRWREHYTNVLGCEPGSSFVRTNAPVVPFDLWKRITMPLIVLGLALVMFVSATVRNNGDVDVAGVNRQMAKAAAAAAYPPPSTPLSAELPDAFRQQIYARIRYAGTSKLVQGVTFEVALTDNGRIVMLRKLASSGDEKFDAAVGQALTASQPFPPNLQSTLYVGIDPGKIP